MRTRVFLNPSQNVLVGSYPQDAEHVHVVLDSSASAFSVDLPDLFLPEHKEIIFYNVPSDGAGHDVTINAISGQVILNSNTSHVLQPYDVVGFVSDLKSKWLLSDVNKSVDWSLIINTPTTLAGYGITDAAPLQHELVGSSHTASELTTGHFLKALSSTTFGFAAHGLTYSDVGAAASVHYHSSLTSQNGLINPAIYCDDAATLIAKSRIKFDTCDAYNGASYAIIGLNAGSDKNFAIYDYYRNRPLLELFGATQGAAFWGNVGIGISPATAPLHVNGLSILSNTNGNNYNENVRLPAASNGYASVILGAVDGTSGTGVGQWALVRYPIATYNNMFAIRHNITDYLNITTSGNVGIGTTDPKAPLQVSGDRPVNIYSKGRVAINGYTTDDGTTWKSAVGTFNSSSYLIDGSNVDFLEIKAPQDSCGNPDDTISFVTAMRIFSGNLVNGTTDALIAIPKKLRIGSDIYPVAELDVTGSGQISGSLTVGDASAAIGKIDILHSDGDDTWFYLRGTNIAHGMTSLASTDAFLQITTAGADTNYSNGGALIRGFSAQADTSGLKISGIIGVTDPTDTTPALLLTGSKKNTTGDQTLGSAETVFGIDNLTTDLLRLFGNGNANLNGTLQIDGLRIDQTPSAGTFTPDKYLILNCNGTNYKFACVAA